MNNLSENFDSYTQRVFDALKTIDSIQLDKVHDEIVKRINTKNSIYVFGNGGSQANAHHIVGDYTKTFSLAGLKLKISCLADNICYLTAASNDISYEEAYSILLGTIIEPEDLLIYLSGSGNSLNLVKCARKASSQNICQIAITSFSGGALRDIVDIPVYVNVFDMEISEDIQLMIFHYIKQKLIKTFANYFDDNLTPKYDKRTKEDLVS